MPIGFGIARNLLNRVRRFGYWVRLELMGFIDRVGPDVTEEVIDTIGVGYKECEIAQCARKTKDWYKCYCCGMVKCTSCGQFLQCDICLKWYCQNCQDFTILDCHQGQICEECHSEYIWDEFYYLDCCEGHYCCGTNIYENELLERYVCENHIYTPDKIVDETNVPLHTRIRQREHQSLMATMRHRYDNRNDDQTI